MKEIRLPISIVYETSGRTPIAEVIAALQAAESISSDAVSLLPSLIDGLRIEGSSLNVHSLTEGSLREAFFLALLFTYQPDLEEEVLPMLEHLFDITVSDKYDSLATLVFLIVLFYGTGIAIDMAKKAFTDSLPRKKLNELIEVLALETGKSPSDVRKIVEARFEKPAAAKRIVRSARQFFRPSKRDGNAPILADRDIIPREFVEQVPYPGDADQDHDFDRYEPHSQVVLELHAQDKDKNATGWAAVAEGISEKRLKIRIMPPCQPSDLWQKERVTADIVVVSKLTSDGFTPSEIQITSVQPGTD